MERSHVLEQKVGPHGHFLSHDPRDFFLNSAYFSSQEKKLGNRYQLGLSVEYYRISSSYVSSLCFFPVHEPA